MNTNERQSKLQDATSARLSDGDLRGLTVISADGQFIGEVTSLFLGRQTWKVEALHIKLRADIADRLGVERSVFRSGELEVPTRWVQSVGETVVLTVPESELKSALPPAAAKVPAAKEVVDNGKGKAAQ